MSAKDLAIKDIIEEYDKAVDVHGAFSCAHHGYAVMLEEVDELWDEVKKKPSIRDPRKMRAEAKQIAAMALRFMVECSNDAGLGEMK